MTRLLAALAGSAIALYASTARTQGYVPRAPDTTNSATVSTIPLSFAPPQPNHWHTLGSNWALYPIFRGQTIGDLDGDGLPEIALCPYYYNFQPQLPIVILRNQGGGRFVDGTAQLIEGPVPTCGSPNNFFIRDFNGDGRPDLLIVDQGLEDKDPNNPGMDGGLNILLASQPNGRLRDVSATAFPGQARNFNHVSSVGDVNGDGAPDVVLTRLGGPRLPGDGLVILLNDGTGRFAENTALLPAEVAQRLTLQPGIDYQSPGANGLGDVDGDGRLDIVSATYTNGDYPSGRRTVRVYQQQASGNFVERARVDIPAAIANIPYFAGGSVQSNGNGGLGASGVTITDFDRDGRNDILVTWEGSGPSYFQFLRNMGNFTYTDVTEAWFGRYQSHYVAQGFNNAAMISEARDVNGDGIPDLVIRRGYVDLAGMTPSAVVYLNDGTGRFTPWTWNNAGSPVSSSAFARSLFCDGCGLISLLWGDVDGDGIEEPVTLRYLTDFNANPIVTRGFEIRAFRSTFPMNPPSSFKGLWWGGGAENGWGMSIAQRGNALFLALYVYDAQGNPAWYVVPGGSWNPTRTVFTGDAYFPRGAPFDAYNAASFAAGASVGRVTITFAGSDAATLAYSIAGASGTKAITRLGFASGAALVRYDDLWWGGSTENGWGLNIAQQADVLFAVWYTYDAAGVARWYVIPGGSWSGTTYTGRIYRTRSSPWLGVPYVASSFAPTDAGNLTLRFRNADAATMIYTLGGSSQSKAITRLGF